MPWAVIEAQDEETGEWYGHILPIVEVDGFKTKAEAEAFLAKMGELGDPCITDDGDTVIATYIGHTLSPSCPCCPKPKESDDSCLIHNLFN